MRQRLRIFISSPADVPDERLRADLIIEKLSQDYSRFFAVESYRWEYEPMLASGHFQDALQPPSAFDIVVLILWSRLGTPLPEKTAKREYRGIDGRAPVTGTEWEYEEALEAARDRGAPDLLAFRNISPTPIDPRDPDAQVKSIGQLAALNAFWTRHFVDRGVFLAAYDEYRTLEDFAQRFEQSLRKLIERRIKALAAGETIAPIWTGDPFRGLQSYEFEHAPIFFGRDATAMKATEQIAANARNGSAFLLVSGASGSGKSSLVKAGILPRLMKPQRISGMAFLRRAVFRPGSEGSDVFLGLAELLTGASNDTSLGLPELTAKGQNTTQLATHLRGSEPSYLFANALGGLTEAERQSGRLLAFEDAKLILVVDQLEEVFTIGPDEQRLFISLLAALARSGAVWVIATLRADFWHRAAEIPQLIALAEGLGRLDLAAPSSAELAEMIRKPAQAAGLSFEEHPESGLALDAMLAEHAAAAPGALPLLSFTLDELYQEAKARGETVLTHVSYEALGGLEGAIANRADEIVSGLPAAAQAALTRVLRALTTVTGAPDQALVARSTPLDTFAEGTPARMVVDAFTAARLLVASSEGSAQPTVRLAHEALISRWRRARDQFAADRRDLETRALIQQQFARWSQAHGRARRLLLARNPDLANAVDLTKRWGDELDAQLRNFIARSARNARLAQTMTTLAAILFLAIAVAAVYAAQKAMQAGQEAEDQRLRALAEVANTEQLRGNLDGALRLGVLAARLPSHQYEEASTARAALTSAVAQSEWQLLLRTNSDYREESLRSAAFSPNGSRVAMVSDAGVVICDSASGKRLFSVYDVDVSNYFFVAYSPDGARIVTATGSSSGKNNTAVILDAATGREIMVLRGHEGPVRFASFSSDGSRVVTGSDDGTARVWNAETGEQVMVLRHENGVANAAFSPDGTRIVTATGSFSGWHNTARVWDAAIGKEIMVLRGHEGPVRFASFSPNGKLIVTASLDHTARIWDAMTGNQQGILRGHEDDVESAVFSPDGTRILTASDDKTARIWDAATGSELATLRGHENFVGFAAFSSDGSRIVTASGDGTARIWSATVRGAIPILRGHQANIKSAAFSPDGTRIATASLDGTGRIWDASNGKVIAILRGHEGGVLSAAFSPDGTRIVTASGEGVYSREDKPDNTARVWDASTGREIAVLRGHNDDVISATFSPDSRRLVTASYDTTARIWDAADGTEIATLRGHESLLKSAIYSPDGARIVTASVDNTARLWDARTGAALATLSGHTDTVNSAVFSPDGSRVVTASDDNTARLWDVATGKEIAVLRGHRARIVSATFSPDGSRVLTAAGYNQQDDDTARIWDAATGKETAVLRGHIRFLNSAAFSPDGLLVVTASADKTARIWDAVRGTEMAVLRVDDAEVKSAAFNADGSRIVTVASGTARIWMFITQQCLQTTSSLRPACGAFRAYQR
jgi:WD40 repeat protein